MTVADTRTYQNYIGGEWTDSVSGETYAITSPASKAEVVGEFQRSNVEDAQRAAAAADAARTGWADTPAPARGQVLYRALDIIERRAEEIARTITIEEGKPIADARGEVRRAMNIIEYAAGEGRRMFGYTTPSELASTVAYTVRRPLGAVALITPWNFPIAIPAWKLAPALICGNTVVFKPASGTPLSAVKLVEVFEEAGLPPGVLNLITGPGASVGNALVESPQIQAISFTGSTEIGTDIYARGARLLKKIQCEMGGKNAVILLADADLDKAVGGIVQGAFGSTGQRCTATSRAIVEKDIHDRFVDQLLDRTGKLKIGDGLDPEVDVSPSIQPVPAGQGAGVHWHRDRGRRESGPRRSRAERRHLRPRILCGADGIHWRHPRYAHRPGGNLRPGADGARGPGPGRRRGNLQQRPVRVVLVGVHPGPAPRSPVHQHRGDGNGPRQRPHSGRRGAFALRRHEVVGGGTAGSRAPRRWTSLPRSLRSTLTTATTPVRRPVSFSRPVGGCR